MTLQGRIAEADAALVPLAGDFAAYRRRVIFQSYKWDPQVGDVSTICDHACVLPAETLAQLRQMAEALAAETMALEEALLQRPDLYRVLGLGSTLSRALAQMSCGPSVRVMRFDFHPTASGWAVSEVNSDVPGGFAEVSVLPELAAELVPGTRAAGDVGDALVAAVSRQVRAGGRLAFVHATSYADDKQVMQFLASRFTAAGFQCGMFAPDHLRWHDGLAVSIKEGAAGPVDGMLRFFPAEWLPNLPRESGWRGYFRTATFACNPVRALLTQSKRLPLLWDELGVEVPAWRRLLPETRAPHEAPWRRDGSWMLKPALGRVGEGLVWRGGVPAKIWRHTRVRQAMAPRQWVAQRRFESMPLPSRDGARHLCIGVFTVDGKAAGFYGRLSATPTIEKHAQDVAILIREEQA
jgi:glutathionylspermidine synthase